MGSYFSCVRDQRSEAPEHVVVATAINCHVLPRVERVELKAPAPTQQIPGTPAVNEPSWKDQDTSSMLPEITSVVPSGKPRDPMLGPPRSPNNAERNVVCEAIGMYHAPRCPELEVILEATCRMLDMPSACVALYYNGFCWINAGCSFDCGRVGWMYAACPWNLLCTSPQTMVCGDVWEDARHFHQPWTTAGKGMRCYCSAPLLASNGHRLGTVCVMDPLPRRMDASMCRVLNNMGELAVRALERHLGLAHRLVTARRQVPPALQILMDAAGKDAMQLSTEAELAKVRQSSCGTSVAAGQSSSLLNTRISGRCSTAAVSKSSLANVGPVSGRVCVAEAQSHLVNAHTSSGTVEEPKSSLLNSRPSEGTPAKSRSFLLNAGVSADANRGCDTGQAQSLSPILADLTVLPLPRLKSITADQLELATLGAGQKLPRAVESGQNQKQDQGQSNTTKDETTTDENGGWNCSGPLVAPPDTARALDTGTEAFQDQLPADAFLANAFRRQLRNLNQDACLLIIDVGMPGWPILYCDDTWMAWTGVQRATILNRPLQEVVKPAVAGSAWPRWEGLQVEAAASARFVVPGLTAVVAGEPTSMRISRRASLPGSSYEPARTARLSSPQPSGSFATFPAVPDPGLSSGIPASARRLSALGLATLSSNLRPGSAQRIQMQTEPNPFANQRLLARSSMPTMLPQILGSDSVATSASTRAASTAPTSASAVTATQISFHASTQDSIEASTPALPTSVSTSGLSPDPTPGLSLALTLQAAQTLHNVSPKLEFMTPLTAPHQNLLSCSTPLETESCEYRQLLAFGSGQGSGSGLGLRSSGSPGLGSGPSLLSAAGSGSGANPARSPSAFAGYGLDAFLGAVAVPLLDSNAADAGQQVLSLSNNSASFSPWHASGSAFLGGASSSKMVGSSFPMSTEALLKQDALQVMPEHEALQAARAHAAAAHGLYFGHEAFSLTPRSSLRTCGLGQSSASMMAGFTSSDVNVVDGSTTWDVGSCGGGDGVKGRVFDLAFRPMALDLIDDDALPLGMPSFVPMEASPAMLRLYAVRLHEATMLPPQALTPRAKLTSLYMASPQAQAAHLFPGITVDALLGRGGYGTVYHGFWHGAHIVVKIQDYELENETALQEAQVEVALGQLLNHPNLVRTLAHASAELVPPGSSLVSLGRSTAAATHKPRHAHANLGSDSLSSKFSALMTLPEFAGPNMDTVHSFDDGWFSNLNSSNTMHKPPLLGAPRHSSGTREGQGTLASGMLLPPARQMINAASFAPDLTSTLQANPARPGPGPVKELVESIASAQPVTYQPLDSGSTRKKTFATSIPEDEDSAPVATFVEHFGQEKDSSGGGAGPTTSDSVSSNSSQLHFPLSLRTFSVIEFCDGGTLQEAIDRGFLRKGDCSIASPPNMHKVVSVALQVASAVAHLHSMGVVHADLSASNVLLCYERGSSGQVNEGNLRLMIESAAATQASRTCSPLCSTFSLDAVGAEAGQYRLPVRQYSLMPLHQRNANDFSFVAKVSDYGKSQLIPAQGYVQTASYATITHMAPEVVAEGLLSSAADAYAWGVLVWQMLTSSRPWAGMSHRQIIACVALGGMRLEWPGLDALFAPGSGGPGTRLLPGGGAAMVLAEGAGEPSATHLAKGTPVGGKSDGGAEEAAAATERRVATALMQLADTAMTHARSERPTMAQVQAAMEGLLDQLVCKGSKRRHDTGSHAAQRV